MSPLLKLAPVLALLALAGCKREPVSARVDPALAPLVPADTVLLAGMRLDKLKETRFYKTYIEGRQIPQLEEFAEQTGLDPRRDLWELVLASNGKDIPLVLVRGKFGGMFGQEPPFTGKGTVRRNYKGYNILGSEESAVTFMNASVAIAGAPAALERLIDARDDPKPGVPPALSAMVAQVPPASQMWVVTTAGGALLPTVPAQGNLSNLARMLAALQQATLFADVSDGVQLKAEGTYSDASAAQQISEALRGFVGLGRLTTKTTETDMLRFYDGIKVTQQDRRVDVSVEAPFELVQKLTERLRMLRRS